jgi:signal transduction histidine kinase
MSKEILAIRPYARLLTMLGEQLIKNERIALVEIIKNSYDADATWVKVTFQNFKPDYSITKESKILIEDNGTGMTYEIIKKHWLNPATPIKLKQKKIKSTTEKGRVIQGEKGIGRFALLKLGRSIEIFTRPKKSEKEYAIEYDFSKFDKEFIEENGKEKELYIDDLKVTVQDTKPSKIIKKEIFLKTATKVEREDFGTLIEIKNLNDNWTEDVINEILYDTTKLESIFGVKDKSGKKVRKSGDFEILFYKDNIYKFSSDDDIEKLNILIENKAVFQIEKGYFNAKELKYTYNLNEKPYEISLEDKHIKSLRIFRKRFGDNGEILEKRKIDCGSFEFEFFVFDLGANAKSKYLVDKNDKKLLKKHRIYLYRDGIRVYPYGEPEDDWLRIDTDRGTISAGEFLSNDQVVGYINITQKDNPKLKDKTNREGLIDEGNATGDFITLIRIFLSYIRLNPYTKYRDKILSVDQLKKLKEKQIEQNIEVLKTQVQDNKKAIITLNLIEKDYKHERDYLIKRAEVTEDLAGVGLSVETASHDIMSMMSKILDTLNSLISEMISGKNIDKQKMELELETMKGMMSFVHDQLKDIQLIFTSTKSRAKNITVKEIFEKIRKIYEKILKKNQITLEIVEEGSPLIAKTTDAVLLQLFLNLFDNSIYWLKQISSKEKKILIKLDGQKGTMIFSDNGPGIDDDDKNFIFDAFYTTKGEEGRGLGLYIARQLLDRYDYQIDVADTKNNKLLNGANFIVDFIKREE